MIKINRYNNLNEYLKNKFGEKVLKICIDGGFTCPNRDGRCGFGGCIFCGEAGAGEHLHKQKYNDENSKLLNCNASLKNIENQVKDYFSSYKAKRANKFIIYFQNFSNTYDTLDNLKKKYDAALIDDRIVGLSVATRPDLINEDVAKLLASYSDKYFVSVELGLQTSNDNTGKLINRGYDSKVFSEATRMLRKYGIEVISHIMIGLPFENKTDLINTVTFLNQHDLQGIKIHSTYIIKGTKLFEMYENNEYVPLELDEYIDLACFVISHLRNDFIIHRISGDAPKDLLVAPEWNLHKKWIINGIYKKLKSDDLWQGKFYST